MTIIISQITQINKVVRNNYKGQEFKNFPRQDFTFNKESKCFSAFPRFAHFLLIN